MYFTRKSPNSIVLPKQVLLDGKNLPWVEKADHLGHVMHQSGTMKADGARARGSFMTKSSDIRDNLYFADPRQRVQAIQLYCCYCVARVRLELEIGVTVETKMICI